MPNSSHLSHPKYRPDIDGLRALAVLAVVAFHGFPNWMKGGFIGVDVFFVISGYLISTILFENLDNGTFSFIEFYSRRIRRIFPALILILVACFAFGWFTLLADEYKQLGKHIAAGAGFISNLVLWSDAGYFDNSADTKPLLHLWSLGVEEQFYIIWPVLLWFAWKRKFNLLSITILVAAVSFSLNLKGIKHDALATFYSPQTRFWELLAGTLLAWFTLYRKCAYQSLKLKIDSCLAAVIYREKTENNGATLSNVLSMMGLALLVYGFWRINKESAFPGWWALIPIAGTVLLIAAGSKTWINRHILSNRFAVWFGLISFPLYLWHWPLLSFARIIENETPSREIRIGLVLIAVVLAWVTYWLIERPIRLGERNRLKITLLIATMTMVAYLGFNTFERNGLQLRKIAFEAAILENYNYFNGKSEETFWAEGCFNLNHGVEFFIANKCDAQITNGTNNAFIIGDSHSAYLSQYLKGYLIGNKYSVHHYSTAYCTPLSTQDRRQRCRDINNYVWEKILDVKPELLIISGYYLAWAESSDYGESVPYDEYISLKVAQLKSLGIKNILILGQIPTWKDGLPQLLTRKFVLKHRKIPVRTYEGITPESLAWDSKLASKTYPNGVHYLSLKNLLCNEDGCMTIVGQNLREDLIVFDYGHLTKSGAKFLTERLISPLIEHDNP
jgi:peptidoglycan/LPS O-acetylase OafA/YrhL